MTEDELDRTLTQLKGIDIDWAQQARKDIPALVAEVRRLRGVIRNYVNTVHEFPDGDLTEIFAYLERECKAK